ncbi:hypothetical protein [Bacillus sp. ISL-45]|uniref:hypothetical protein n=1 Tax=Bacillus sp. ISL-45 TaxID=2819128 RepID=UPI001BE86D37|nr:hypothetical protein [Bacillus sp. ISL-45]MBT2661657.1 hypothetical protein [Bacillus sp. ISL-45]
MISIRVEEKILVSVTKLIKRHFARIVRSHFSEEEYQSCKNNIDQMYYKIKEMQNQKFDWRKDFNIYSMANDNMKDLENIKQFYYAFYEYSRTPNNLKKYKIEVELSIYLAKKLDMFLDKEITFQILFNKKYFKELNDVLEFQNSLQSAINSFKDNSISISIKADEYKFWENRYEELLSPQAQQEVIQFEEQNTNTHEGRFSDESDLHKLGYKITGLSRYKRWDILKNKAIPQLGLDRTVNIISGLIETRKLQEDGDIKFANAINEWNHDLSMLADYY